MKLLLWMAVWFLVAAFGIGVYVAATSPPLYSNVTGQNHPYCPPDPRECD